MTYLPQHTPEYRFRLTYLQQEVRRKEVGGVKGEVR